MSGCGKLLYKSCILIQLLQELSQDPGTADIDYAKMTTIMKRNRYMDRFPCEGHTTAV